MLTHDASPTKTQDQTEWGPDELALYQAVLESHGASACRRNISYEVLQMAMIGSGSYLQAIAAALSTLGGLHAPLTHTYDLLHRFNTVDVARTLLEQDHMIPGWGNSFVKGEPDALWSRPAALVAQLGPGLMERIDGVTALLHQQGKPIYPNPSCWTAAAGILLGFTRQTVGFLFLQGRLPAWTRALQAMEVDDD